MTLLRKYFGVKLKVFLLRHGETTGDIEDRYGGDYDDHLTENGREESAELAKRLENKNIQKFFVSPRIRAIETSLIIAKSVPGKYITLSEIRERNSYGVLTGLTKKEAQKKFEEEVEEIESNNPYHKLANAEDYFDFAERVLGAFNKTVEEEFENNTEAIAFITHGGPITAIFREILGFELKGIKDCALFELEYDGDGFEIIYAHDVKSIEAGLI